MSIPVSGRVQPLPEPVIRVSPLSIGFGDRLGGTAQFAEVFSGNAELDREADRRTVLQAQEPGEPSRSMVNVVIGVVRGWRARTGGCRAAAAASSTARSLR